MRYFLLLAALLLTAACSDATAAPVRFESAPGQTMDSFVTSIRKEVARLTKVSGVEVCGAIAQRGDTYTVELIHGERLQCVFQPVTGYTGTSLHTHPADAAHGFSAADVEAGPGYLIARGLVYHQDGRKVRRVL